MRTTWLRTLTLIALGLSCATSATQAPVDAGPSSPRVQPAGWDSELRVRELTDENPDPSIVEVSLEARIETVSVPGGPTVRLWTYNGQVPGPVIRAKKGDVVRAKVKNSLPEPTTVHWHGVRVPNAMDGTDMVQTPIAPGETFVYEFSVLDEGTYWYHPHVKSSAQVGFGLYGQLVVEPDAPDGLPADDLPIVLSDLGTDDSGNLSPADESGAFGDFFGREGQHVLVNGRVAPRIYMRAGVAQRWRIVNAARSRYFQLAFADLVVHRLGGDGGRSAEPARIDDLLLVPGERVDLFVVASGAPGSSFSIFDKAYDRFHVGAPSPKPSPLLHVTIATEPAMKASMPPPKLAEIPALDTSSLAERALEFSEVPVGRPTGFGINGKKLADLEPFMAAANTVERWRVTNATAMDHPFHLHGFFFQVEELNGVPWPYREWKDTINLAPRDTIRIAVQFDNRPGMWMFHCHILDHAEAGMMAMLHVH